MRFRSCCVICLSIFYSFHFHFLSLPKRNIKILKKKKKKSEKSIKRSEMADALALTCLGNIAEGFLGKVREYLFAPIQRQLKYMCCFNSNITELETQLKGLETTRQDVQKGVDENRRKVKVVGRTVEDWLTSADKVTNEAEGIIQHKDKVKEGCLNGWCPNLKLRYSLSRKAVKKTKVVVDLKADGVRYTQSSYSPPPVCLKSMINKDFMGFESRRIVMEEIIKALKHDEINLVGVCGMGGVGKTKMVKEVGKRAKEEKLFDEVAFVAVGQNPDLTKFQNSIADIFGVDNLKTKDDATTRASMLRERLSQDNKKILVILDDIWVEFDLEDQGIPLGGANKNFKMLYTSRARRLWHNLQTKKEIPIEILLEDEAWQLFKEKAGDSADAPDLQPIAKQIVDECGCLPLALVLIGSALSKTSGSDDTKEIWAAMLYRLTCVGSTPVDKDLPSRLALSYEYLEDEQAKRLFLFCCLFSDDEDIRIEDLARYGLGLSLFDGIHEMEEVRRQVFLIVHNLKSRYLLLDSEKREEACVKVHDVVRDMGIYIVSKDKTVLVIHEEASELPKDTYEHYSSISLISSKITELPKGLACPNLEFLLLDCRELKELQCQFFEGMEKLKVLVLKNFKGILALPSSLRNLHTLSLPFFNGKLENVSDFGGLFNLNILSFRDSRMEELPEEIGELGKLRLLDLTKVALKRIPPSVISRLVHLEELYVLSNFKDWEGEGKEEEGRNANLRELEFLSNLKTLEICIRSDVLIPKVPIFSKLKIYKVIIVDQYDDSDDDYIKDKELKHEMRNLFRTCKRVFRVGSSIPIPSNRGIDLLLRSSDWLVLEGKGCNDLVQALLLWDGVDGLQQLKLLKLLRITTCDTPECLIDTMNPVHLRIADAPIFPILKVLDLLGLVNLKEIWRICGGPVPARSFGELTFIRIHDCGRLRYLFQLPIVGCLPQLKRLIISYCGMMEEVFWKDQQEDVHAATNRIKFPKLEVLKLEKLPSLVGFCRGIDQIDFPQLKELYLEDIPKVNLLFHNKGNLSSNSKRNDNFSCLSLFPEDVHAATNRIEFPKLEVLKLVKLPSLVGFCRGIDQIDFPQLKELYLEDIPQVNLLFHNNGNLSLFPENGNLSLFPEKVSLPNLEVLRVDKLQNLERLGQCPLSVGSLSKLKEFLVRWCGKLLCVIPSQFLPMLRELQELTVESCFSLEVVFELEGLDSSEPNPEILPPLKFVKLCKLPNLNCISKRDPTGIEYIQTLEIHNCDGLRYVFAPTMTKSIPQLCELKVSSCMRLSRIVAEKNGLGESSVDEVEFPQLERLELLRLPSLLSFFLNVNVNTTTLAKSTDHCHNPMQPQPLFNEKVAIPSLKYLGLSGLQNVRDLWSSELPTSSFSKLKTINVKDFANLRSMFHPSMVGGLANLSELVITDCSTMKGVVYWEEEIEDEQERKVEKTLFPLLRKLRLLRLPNLVSFFPNVNGNTTTLAKSTDHFHNPLKPQPFFNEKVVIPSLEYLELSGLETVSDLWCSKLPTSSFSKLKTLHVRGFTTLRSTFHPSIVRGLVNLSELVITDCSKMEGVVYWEEGIEDGQGRKVQKTLFPLLRRLQLSNLPNLVSFFLNVNVNTTTLAKSNDHLHKPKQPQPLFNEKVAFPTSSLSKPKNLQVTDSAGLRSFPGILWIDDLHNTTQGLQEVAQLLYTKYGNVVLALGSNGTMKLWDWPSGKVTTSVLPQQWEQQPQWCRAMTNDVTGVNLDEAVPCMALSKDYSRYMISACGGKILLYDAMERRVMRTFMQPPPASTFLAFHPQTDDIIAIGMEDSTIRIYNHRKNITVKSELKGHEKRITGLAFSSYLNILVSSAANAQLCIWRIDTWEHLKSVSIQLPASKARNGDTRVQFHFDQIRLLVSHETQLAIYDASEMDRIRQWVRQDILPAPISFAVYSCDNQLVYTSFCDGNIGVFDADSLTLACRIVPSIYLYSAMSSGGHTVYPRVIAAHPKMPNQFAIGLTNGVVVVMEPQESKGKWGLSPAVDHNGMLNDRTTSSSNTSNHTPLQNRRKEEEEEKEDVDLDLDEEEDVDADENEEDQEENGDGPMARSMEKPKTLDDVTDKSKPWKVTETQCQLVVMPDSTDEAHKVARLLYKNGCEVLALGCNGALRLWRRYSSINNQSGMATASVVPQQWQPASGLAMTNDVTGVNLEEAVPCMALSNNYSYDMVSACGGEVSLFNIDTFKVMKKLSPPSTSTFLAFHPQDDDIIAIGMEDSTIRISHCLWHEESELKGHEKRITGLAFSTNLKILVSSGADAQLCIWRIDTWEHLKSVPIQQPAGKACNSNTTVQFHSDQIRLLVSQETQLVIYDAFKMDNIHQWVPQDVLPAPISFATYSCNSQLVYTSFCDGNIGVFDADSLTPTHRIAPSAYSPTLSSGSHAVYPLVVATHPWKPNQFAIGLTNGSVIIMEPQESEGKWGLSSNTSNHAPDQNQRKEEEELDENEEEEDQEEKRKRKEKGKAPRSG